MVHEDQRLFVMLQREITPARLYTSCSDYTEQVAAILRGFSLREQQRLPLRWYAEEAPPKKIFREDELEVLAPQLADALQKVGPEERVYFELFAPGMNPLVPTRCHRRVGGGARSTAPSDHRLLSCSAAGQNIRSLRLQLSNALDPCEDLPPIFRAGSILCG